MCEGEIRKLIVPPDMAYGDEGLPDTGLPGGQTVVYEVELVKLVRFQEL